MTSIVANFSVSYTQYLSPEGKPTADLPAFANDLQSLLKLYRLMILTRTFDAKAVALQRTGKLGTYPSALGQEALFVGLGAAMKPEDILCPAYREIGAQFQRGVRMIEILQYWGGDERGNHFKNNKEDLPICIPIGSQCLHAAGIAFAFNYRKENRVAVVNCGDGATSQGEFYEAMNIAGAWHLPVVFLINNNQWAISMPRSHQTAAKTLAQKAIAAGFEGEQVDGNDVIAVQDVLQKAIEKTRREKKPHLIEALTYRLSDHTTADDATRYRTSEELENAKKADPLLRLHHYLTEKGILNKTMETELREACAKEVEAVAQEFASLKNEPVSAMFEYEYYK